MLEAPGKPNAHFTFKRGISFRLNPAARAGWWRRFVLAGLTPHPFQEGAFRDNGAGVAQAPIPGLDGPVSGWPRKSATARRSASVSWLPCALITPDSSARRMLPRFI